MADGLRPTVTCPSCGREARAGARFCPGCGSGLPAATCTTCGAVPEQNAQFCDTCGSPLAAPTSPVTTQSTPVAAPISPAPQPARSGVPESFDGGRYQVSRFLGEGGRKRVYQAYDRALDREVALATVKTEGFDEGSLERVRREAQAMGRLGDHPHIVTVYDIGEEDGRPFIVSQYMPGGSLDDLLEGAPDHRLSVPEAVRIAAEICEALEHAHARDIVHRDIKPANVWLTEGTSTRLGDFGLAAVATATSRSRLTREGMMVGTVAYMAPEQALGSAVDARADLYSLGALLYELLTGRPPFVGPDAVTVISQQINTPPMAPWWHNPAVPKELGALVLELLAKTPEERPASAGDVRRRLLEAAAVPDGEDAEVTPETPAPAGTRHSARLNRLSRFVGRSDELRDLKRAVEGALQGRGALVMLSGEPGIGKTRLAEEAGVYARLGGARVLTGRCHETESSVPYMPFIEAIRAYVGARPPDELRVELGDAASDVAKLVSEIRSRIPDLPTTPRSDGEEERYRLFESVSSFLVNASQATPIVLILDDLHWSDAPSLRLLQHLARRLADSRMLVLGTYRDVELGRRHPLAQALVELRRDHSYQRIGLRGLSLEEVRQFLEGMTEREMEAAEQPLVLAFYRETEGNPYFLEEVLRHLLETGGAYWEAGRWAMDLASVESLAIPEGIRELIGRRLGNLSDAANDVLTRAAVLGPQFDYAVLEQLSELDEDTLLEAIEEALHAQLIEQSGSQRGQAVYAFGHAIVRQTLYDDISLPRRQRLHRRAAEAIEGVYHRNLVPHLPALALHHRQAGGTGDPGKAIEYSVAAGEAAQSVFAYEDAVRHWEAALDLLETEGGDAVTRAVLSGRLGDLKFTTGLDYEGGIRCVEEALRIYQELDMSERAAQMHSRLGRDLSSFPATMDIPRALSHYRAAETILAAAPESSALGYVFYGTAVTRMWDVRTQEGLAAAERAIAVAEHVGNDRLRHTAATARAYHLFAAGRPGESLVELERIWGEADAAHDATLAFTATWIGALDCLDLGDPTGALGWCRRELESGRLAQAPNPRRILQDEMARAHALAGQLTEARALVEDAGATKYTAPYLALREGRWEEATRLWQQQREDDRRRGNRRDEWMATYRLGTVQRLEENIDRAESFLGEALNLAVDGGRVPAELWTRRELALALVDAGRTDEAAAQLERCRTIVGGGDDWGGLAGRVTLAEAALLTAQLRPDQADERFAEAIEAFRRFSLPWDEAEALHRWGRARLAAGDHRRALERLGGALEIYGRLGAGARWVDPVLGDKLLVQGVDRTRPAASIDIVAAAALEERPDLAPHAAPDGTVTLLFSDIEGSTAANERLGDQRWLEVLHTHNRIVRDQVKTHGGFEVKAQGDGFMVAFGSARRALQCAVGIQQALRDHGERHPDEATQVRIGLHTGEAIKEGDDFFGTHVALAARIAAAASGGEILVSALLKELTEAAGDVAFGAEREVQLKGLTGRRRVHEVLWGGGTQGNGHARPSDESARRRRPLATLLFTDLDAGRQELLAQALNGRGADVQPLDGGLLVAFPSAADAVRAAITLQQEATRAGEPPAVRVGLHAGESPAVPDDASEPAVVIARALCRRADPGQILCSDTLTRLLAGRPGFAFAAIGQLEPEVGPTAAFEVRYEPEVAAFLKPVALIGRDAELTTLSERLQQAVRRQGGLVMLAGEPGIGKTRIMEEVGAQAERDGFAVLWGRCHEGEWPPPFGPFAEALEAHAVQSDPAELRADLGSAAPTLSRLVPRLREVLTDISTAPDVPPEEERHRLLDAVAQFLTVRSRRAPVLLLIDDLHWADRSTVAMLRHLARFASRERILVLGTYRDVDLERAHPLTDALTAWPREAGYEHLRLEGLEVDAVTNLLTAMGDQEMEDRVGAAWARETGGNPFFVRELVRHLYEEGHLYQGPDGKWTTTAPLRELPLPAAARDVVARRLSRLSESATRLLTVATAFEGPFRFEVALDLAGLSEDEGLDALDEAVGAQVLQPAGNSETYAFTHVVIRHALYDGLTPSRRSRLHRRAGEALARGTRSFRASAAEIAVQYHRSLALPGAEDGVEPALEAAGRAQDTGAYDEAAMFVRMALDLLPEDDTRRPQLLGRLGIVLAWALNFDEAAEVAARAGDAIAEAETKQAAAEYLSDAAYVCAMAGGIEQSWVLARQGLTYAGARDVAWARMICFDYQRREAEDPEHPGISVDTTERREAAAVLQKAELDPMGPAPMEAVFDSRDDAAASSNLMVIGLWAGEFARVAPLLETEAREAESLGRLSRAARAWAGLAYGQGAMGRLGEAHQSFERGQNLATRLGAPVATLLYPQHLLCTALDEGWEEVAATFGFLRSSDNPALAWVVGYGHAGSALAAAHLGEVDDALAALTSLIPWLERAPAWTAGFPAMACGAAEVLWVLDRVDHLETIERVLRDKLLPADFRLGLADCRHALARCCVLTERHDEAGRWFAEARRVLAEQGAAPLLAICDFDEARMYTRRGGPADVDRARPLLKAAGQQFEAIGMTGWIRRGQQFEAELG